MAIRAPDGANKYNTIQCNKITSNVGSLLYGDIKGYNNVVLIIMIMIMKFLFPCYKFRYYSRSRIYYKYNTEANEDRKMSPTLAGSHLSVLMCLYCHA